MHGVNVFNLIYPCGKKTGESVVGTGPHYVYIQCDHSSHCGQLSVCNVDGLDNVWPG